MTLRLSVVSLCAVCLWLACRKPDEQASRLLQQAEEALARQQWEQAFDRARQAASVAGISEALRHQAHLKEEQARRELQAQSQYARFVGALDTDPDTAVRAYRDLPEGSFYRQQGREAFERILPQYISDHLERAEQAFQHGRCQDGTAELQLVLEVDATNARAQALRGKGCSPAR
ncbi:MAG: hypothetical protein RMK29_19945 [Myxococcales bacterium]|nr:hypothetical protein [Myxococcota bacterium]MDW8283982.1 hypothetical protein [Myxococcales bacterium]